MPCQGLSYRSKLSPCMWAGVVFTPGGGEKTYLSLRKLLKFGFMDFAERLLRWVCRLRAQFWRCRTFRGQTKSRICRYWGKRTAEWCVILQVRGLQFVLPWVSHDYRVKSMSSFRPALMAILLFISICQSSGNLLLKPGKPVTVLVLWVNRGVGNSKGGADACSVQLH